MIQRHSIFSADQFWNFKCIKSYSDKSPKQLSSKANSFDKKKTSFHIKSKRTLNDRPACSIVSVWYTSWESTRPVLCVFIRWRKSGRNNNGSSNQQQCLLFVRLNTLTHSKCAIRSRHCEFVMAKRNFMRSEISYTLYSCACAS